MDNKFKLMKLFENLQILGKYDANSKKFNKSFKFYIVSYLILFVNLLFGIKFVFFYFKIDNEDKIVTILIGDM